jgi:hypothetical protein
MRKPLVARLAACLAIALLGTAGAAFAGAVYIPVPDPVKASGSTHSLQIWITNAGTAQRSYTATLLTGDSDGTQRPGPTPTGTPVAVGRTTLLGGLGIPGRVNLLELNADAAMSIEARLVSTPPTGQISSASAVPLISSDNLFEAGKKAVILGLRRDNGVGDVASLGIVNLGKQASQCQVKLFRADGSQIATTATLTFKPLSLRYFEDAFALLGEAQVADARAEVSCTQPFYAYAAQYLGSSSQLLFVTPAASGASTLTGPDDSQGPPTSTGSFIFTAPGLFHTATPGNEKKTFNIALPSQMVAKSVIVDMDFVPGPWNHAKTPGNHALVWLYRGKFRGNTIANVNAFSPPKQTLKAAQNINLPAGNTTQDEQGVPWVQGQRYHLKYTYDAQHGTITTALSSNGATLRTLTFPGTAPGGVLDIPASGLTAEFGHYANQEGPEVASYNWQYWNLRIEVVP